MRPFILTYNTWELFIENPPETHEEAKKLAIEILGFCKDTVFGTEFMDIDELANLLEKSHYWYFWWK